MGLGEVMAFPDMTKPTQYMVALIKKKKLNATAQVPSFHSGSGFRVSDFKNRFTLLWVKPYGEVVSAQEETVKVE